MAGTASLHHESALWQQGVARIAGVDESGRGPLAGPVVAAAVIFPADFEPIPGVNDSKRVAPRLREALVPRIRERALAVGIGIASEVLIDEIDILQATYRAMQSAINALGPPPDMLLIDGRGGPRNGIPARHLIRGDSASLSIAAASIVAKVTRDRLMAEYDRVYPQYGFARHKGYATRAHVAAIRRHGLCPIHRRTFRPCCEIG